MHTFSHPVQSCSSKCGASGDVVCGWRIGAFEKVLRRAHFPHHANFLLQLVTAVSRYLYEWEFVPIGNGHLHASVKFLGPIGYACIEKVLANGKSAFARMGHMGCRAWLFVAAIMSQEEEGRSKGWWNDRPVTKP